MEYSEEVKSSGREATYGGAPEVEKRGFMALTVHTNSSDKQALLDALDALVKWKRMMCSKVLRVGSSEGGSDWNTSIGGTGPPVDRWQQRIGINDELVR